MDSDSSSAKLNQSSLTELKDMNKILAHGVGGIKGTISGKVIIWDDTFYDNSKSLEGKIVYNTGNIPLYRAAFLVDARAKCVLMEKGGKNFHPLILLNDALIPSIAGIGNIDFKDIIFE